MTDGSNQGGPELEPWEVFRQEKEGDPMRHGGSVMAPDGELAVHYAREMFGRRQESVRLWVVRRADILDLEDDVSRTQGRRSFENIHKGAIERNAHDAPLDGPAIYRQESRFISQKAVEQRSRSLEADQR